MSTIEDLGRKYEEQDVTPALAGTAASWLESYTGDFEFLVSLKRRAAANGGLSRREAKGVLNCMRAENRRSVPQEPSGRFDLSGVPDGEYAVRTPDGEFEVAFYTVDRGREGTGWEGFIFVRTGGRSDGHPVGRQAPGSTAYVGKVPERISEIARDPKAAALLYAEKTGRCYRCAALLTDPESIARGMGPICASYLS